MFKKKLMKMLALVLVMNVLIIPLTSFSPQEQNKYNVYAAEGIVDIRFFNAVVSMLGITAAGLATMSPSFTIPEADLIEMKNNFAQTLEADAVKKQAWMAAQTDYLAGGIAKTMGAVELAKIGIYDIYNQFKNYLSENYYSSDSNQLVESGNVIRINDGTLKVVSNNNVKSKLYSDFTINATQFNPTYSNEFSKAYYVSAWPSVDVPGDTTLVDIKYFNDSGMYLSDRSFVQIYTSGNTPTTKFAVIVLSLNLRQPLETRALLTYLSSLGVKLIGFDTLNYGLISGTYSNENIIPKSEDTISLFPTIPWIDTTVPVGTIVTPAISAPYAGAVPIDVPITAPIDPPIDVPDNPPTDATLIGTVAAILAGITPISGILDNIFAGQLDIADVISAGLTDVIDGIGDIAGTLTSGISSTLTDISTTITDFVNPSPETVSELDLNPIKNIPGVLFTRFPFSIPFDFYNIISYMGGSAREAPVFEFKIDLSSLGLPDIEKQIDMQPFDQIAGYVRIAELIAFSVAVMLKTKTLIWG